LTEDFIVIDSDRPAVDGPDDAGPMCQACKEAEILRSGLHILNYAFSVEALYEGILSVLTKIVPFSEAAIVTQSIEGGMETVVNHAGRLKLELEIVEGAFADVFDGEIILAEKLSRLEGWAKAAGGTADDYSAAILMPLKSIEEPAVIVCVHAESIFTDDHLRALVTFAPIAAQAVQWARQRQEMEQHRHHLEELVRERTDELAEQKERLAQSLQKELELSGLQRQFVSMVCHEFRTPLAIIDGNAQRVERRHADVEPDRLLRSVGKMRGAVSRLINLIESVLDAAKLEAGTIRYQPRPLDLKALVSEVCGSYGEVNPDYKIEVDVDGLDGVMVADVAHLRQAVSNLVSNAIRYSPKGTEVWVRVASNGADQISLSVRDNGVGIPKEEIRKLFDRFYRGSSSTGIVGTGIGLHLVKTMVDMHGGHIDVESQVGEGTTFTITLPRQAKEQSRKDGAAVEPAA
jgi:signal transduction histidine kinase